MAPSVSAVVSKAEFARLSNVTPTRVGQWIREGKLSGPALVGEGRRAQINVAIARRQLGDRRDLGQSMGNGLETRLVDVVEDLEPQAHGGGLLRRRAAAEDLEGVGGDPLAGALKTERLRELRFRNGRLAEEALERRGLYVRTDETSAAMTRVAAKMLTAFEAGLGEIAAALAGELGLDRRTVLQSARAAWRGVRAKVADAARREAEDMSPLIEDEVDDADAAGEA